jgi:hypothetical protein
LETDNTKKKFKLINTEWIFRAERFHLNSHDATNNIFWSKNYNFNQQFQFLIIAFTLMMNISFRLMLDSSTYYYKTNCVGNNG